MKASLFGAFLAMAGLNSVGAETGPARGSAYTIIRFNTATGDYDRAAMDRQKFDESMRLFWMERDCRAARFGVSRSYWTTSTLPAALTWRTPKSQ